MGCLDIPNETFFTMEMTPIKFGPGAISYPIAGQVKNFSPPGYPKDEPMIPHGLSVVITAPSTFRWTYPASPERHLRAAQLLGGNVHGLTTTEMSEALPRTLLSLMHDTGIANGLDALGYGEADVSTLIDGTLKQQRLLVNCPRAVGAEELRYVIQQSFKYW